jgi:ubiquinone/menaquinone biosynthesis C-methylase UbiE
LTILYVFLGLIGLALAIGLGWRLVSERRALPCPAWLAWLVELDNPFTKTNRSAEIIRHLDLRPGMQVADIGCGPGRLTIPLARAVLPGGAVLAADLQPAMLRRAQARAEAAGLSNIRFLQTAVGEGQLGVGRYDRALLVTVLGEIPDRAGALKEIFAALKPGGILSVTEVIFDPHFQGHASVVELATRAGFREQARFGNRLAFTLLLEKPRGA